MLLRMLRRVVSIHRLLGYEPNAIPLCYSVWQLLDWGETGFQFYARQGLVAGIHGAEDAEGAPALSIPVRVGPARAVALLEVHDLALLAADPRILTRGVCEAPLHQLEVLGGGGGAALLQLLETLGTGLCFGCEHLISPRGHGGLRDLFLLLGQRAQTSPRLLRVELKRKRPAAARGVPFAAEGLDGLLHLKRLAADNQLGLFARQIDCHGGGAQQRCGAAVQFFRGHLVHKKEGALFFCFVWRVCIEMCGLQEVFITEGSLPRACSAARGFGLLP